MKAFFGHVLERALEYLMVLLTIILFIPYVLLTGLRELNLAALIKKFVRLLSNIDNNLNP